MHEELFFAVLRIRIEIVFIQIPRTPRHEYEIFFIFSHELFKTHILMTLNKKQGIPLPLFMTFLNF